MNAPATAIDFDRQTVEVSEQRLGKLRIFNLVMGLLHLVSGSLMVILGNDFELDISTFALDGPPGTPLADGSINQVWGLPLAWATAAFLFLSAFFHLLIASPLAFRAYGNELRRNRNRFRWVEYAISSTLMIVLIALVTGITDLAALISIAFVNASMILFGWLQEKYETPGAGGWLPFIFGCIAGIVPWLIVVLWVIAPGAQSDVAVPGFVYGIIISLFIFFNIFALVQWLQYKRVGRWANYLAGERTYIVLSLVAKSALAWQIFSGTLVPAT